MAVETKTTIQLSDIVRVEFECRKCHSITIWPLAVAQQPPISCACSSTRWMAYGDELFRGISDLLALVKRMGRGSGKEPFIMRFGIQGLSALDRIFSSEEQENLVAGPKVSG
jgi:hypothetical protein